MIFLLLILFFIAGLKIQKIFAPQLFIVGTHLLFQTTRNGVVNTTTIL